MKVFIISGVITLLTAIFTYRRLEAVVEKVKVGWWIGYKIIALVYLVLFVLLVIIIDALWK